MSTAFTADERPVTGLAAAWTALGRGLLFAVVLGAVPGLALAAGGVEDPPGFVLSWGSYGDGPGQFRVPMGLASDASGMVYVADQFNHRVQVFDGSGVFVRQWGSYGSEQGQFQSPVDVAIDGVGNIYVVEYSGWRVQVFTPFGIWLREWDGSNGAGRFASPEGIAIDDSGYVYVSDTGRDIIQKFTSGGTFVSKWGGSSGRVRSPRGVAVDGDGHVYVAEGGIAKYSAMGEYLGSFGEDLMSHSPQYVATDAVGNVYVTTEVLQEQRVVKFDPSGKVLAMWGSGAQSPCAFTYLNGIEVDRFNNVYVANGSYGFASTCIQKFSPGVTPVIRRTWGALKAHYR
jgi:tripartite motif-containing protein 71